MEELRKVQEEQDVLAAKTAEVTTWLLYLYTHGHLFQVMLAVHQRRERFALFGLYFAEASFSCQPARLSYHIIIM